MGCTEHAYDGMEVDTVMRRVCLICLQPEPTITRTRSEIEAELRNVAEFAGRCPVGDGADWYQAVDDHITAALARLGGERE